VLNVAEADVGVGGQDALLCLSVCVEDSLKRRLGLIEATTMELNAPEHVEAQPELDGRRDADGSLERALRVGEPPLAQTSRSLLVV
jgi:hypothetical protein